MAWIEKFCAASATPCLVQRTSSYFCFNVPPSPPVTRSSPDLPQRRDDALGLSQQIRAYAYRIGAPPHCAARFATDDAHVKSVRCSVQATIESSAPRQFWFRGTISETSANSGIPRTREITDGRIIAFHPHRRVSVPAGRMHAFDNAVGF